MRPIAAVIALTTLFSQAFAADPTPPPLVLDKILFQISSKQWVHTQTAVLNVNIHATLNNADLIKARAELMSSLDKMAKGDWQLLEFERSQDNSGLEKFSVQAQARVDQSALNSVYQKAKSLSTPGTKYDIANIEFKPSVEEIQSSKAKIREQLYQLVNEEISRINKVYPTQHYSVSNLTFVEGGDAPQPRPYQAKEMNALSMPAAAPPPLTTSNELILTVLVEAASNRKQGE